MGGWVCEVEAGSGTTDGCEGTSWVKGAGQIFEIDLHWIGYLCRRHCLRIAFVFHI